MSRKVQLIIAGVIGVLCIGGLGATLLDRGSVNDYIKKNYTATNNDVVPGSRSSTKTYASSSSPVDTANKIAGKWKPADRSDTGSGTFLRYSDYIVGITPASNGSYVSVDKDNDGYARWFPYVGGFWGTSSGSGEAARSGGPGAGK